MNMTIKKAFLILFALYACIVFVLIASAPLAYGVLMTFIYVSVIVLGAAIIYIRNTRWWVYPKGPIPREWQKILRQEVSFYKVISDADKRRFEKKVLFFLSNYKIVGVDTEVELLDKLLIASSSIIPTFQKSRWRYTNLDEVLLYPRGFSFGLPQMEKEMFIMSIN